MGGRHSHISEQSFSRSEVEPGRKSSWLRRRKHTSKSRKIAKSRKTSKNTSKNPRYVETDEHCMVSLTEHNNENVYVDVFNASSSGNQTEQENEAEKTRYFRVKALFDYENIYASDLAFRKGDILLVESTRLDCWIEAIHTMTGKKGFIPGNHVRLDNEHPNNLDCYYDIDRLSAEKKLFLPGNVEGSYILRPRGDKKGYALSILYRDHRSKMNKVIHYQIYEAGPSCDFHLEDSIQFRTMRELLDHYSKHKVGSLVKLTIPCPRDFTPPVNFRDFEVPSDSIELDKVIGQGEFGEVWRAIYNKQLEVAVKTRKATTDLDSFLAEAKIMHTLSHPHIVQLLGVCTDPVMIITEFLPKGSLLNVLRSKDGKAIQFKDQLLAMTQICDGMAYLERKGYVHRDLRAANVLVDKDYSVKVADFGLARILANSKEYLGHSKFPVRWTAPEALRGDHIFSIKSDVWSFGILMVEILTYGETPYKGIENTQIESKLLSGYRIPNPLPESNADGQKLYKLMLECWELEPDHRPRFRTLHKAFCMWDIEESESCAEF